jgi:hypothetical protein
LAIILLMSTVAFSFPELSNTEAKQLIEKIWHDPTGVSIKLGSWELTINDFDRGIIKPIGLYYQILQALAKVGIIAIQEGQCFQSYLSFAQSGHNASISADCADELKGRPFQRGSTKITVQKTPKGEELAQKGGLPQQPNSLVIRTGILRVDKIVKNEVQRKGTDEYRVVLCTVKAQWTPEWKQVRAISGSPLSEDWKAITLFKFDPFKPEWVFMAQDLADKDAEFHTNSVSKKLSE